MGTLSEQAVFIGKKKIQLNKKAKRKLLNNLFKSFSPFFEKATSIKSLFLSTLFGRAFRFAVVWNLRAQSAAFANSFSVLRSALSVLVDEHGRSLVLERHQIVVVLLVGQRAHLFLLFLLCHKNHLAGVFHKYRQRRSFLFIASHPAGAPRDTFSAACNK